ncbi:MAG: hypothetical protein H6718_32465 [Polyangiaceae bacterium]|nr:hypothetical protein [Polyangiaceae bacterium]
MPRLNSLGLGLGALLLATLTGCSDDSGEKSSSSGGAAGSSQGGASGSSGSAGSAQGGSAGLAAGGSAGFAAGGTGATSGGSAGGGAGGSSGSAGNATGGSGGSAGNATGGSGGAGCPTGLDDEFNDPCTLSQWTAENFPASAASYDIGTTESGFLTISFSASTPNQTAWYASYRGPILHKRVSGNFWVMAEVHAQHINDANSAPTGSYNSAALLARDVTTPGHWLMHSLGHHGGNSNGPGAGLPGGCPNQGEFVGVGSEDKITVNQASTLCLNPSTAFRGRLALCRMGTQFHMLQKLEGESSWTETNNFTHAQVGSEMDVGPVANAWGVPPDVSSRFDWIHFGVPASDADCSAAAFESAHP